MNGSAATNAQPERICSVCRRPMQALSKLGHFAIYICLIVQARRNGRHHPARRPPQNQVIKIVS